MKFCMNSNNEKTWAFWDDMMKLMSNGLNFDVDWCSLVFLRTIMKPNGLDSWGCWMRWNIGKGEIFASRENSQVLAPEAPGNLRALSSQGLAPQELGWLLRGLGAEGAHADAVVILVRSSLSYLFSCCIDIWPLRHLFTKILTPRKWRFHSLKLRWLNKPTWIRFMLLYLLVCSMASTLEKCISGHKFTR